MVKSLVRNRYMLYNYKKILKIHTFGIFLLTPQNKEIYPLLKNKNIFKFYVSNQMLQLILKNKFLHFFKGSTYFISFKNFKEFLDFFNIFTKNFKKNSLDYEILFVKINKYLISTKLFSNFNLILKNYNSINNFYIYNFIYLFIVSIRLLFNVFNIFLRLIFNMNKNFYPTS